MKFKDGLKKHRNIAHLSQEGLAEKMSVSRQTISKWENGEAYPSTKHIFMLAKKLGCSVDELISCDDNVMKKDTRFFNKRMVYWVVGAFTLTIGVLFGFSFVNNNSEINDLKIAVFNQILDGFFRM